MAGHSHWKQIKVHKGVADQRKAKLFSKLLASIAVAARGESNPQFNPRLKAAIEKAKEYQIPQENIERAIKRTSLKNLNLEELLIEAYGPQGVAILIEAITDSRARTLGEMKLVFKEHDAKLAEPGSVRWVFTAPREPGALWQPKFLGDLDNESRQKLQNLIKGLEELNDVQKVYTNAK
ncbi:MAG: YebC/PmpR family DNA-binding transcriptional regulator [Patescibacteria group bacterium]